jgi:hypothetical protein
MAPPPAERVISELCVLDDRNPPCVVDPEQAGAVKCRPLVLGGAR